LQPLPEAERTIAFDPLLPDDIFMGNGSLLIIKLPVSGFQGLGW
jgi:hypothetical protein